MLLKKPLRNAAFFALLVLQGVKDATGMLASGTETSSWACLLIARSASSCDLSSPRSGMSSASCEEDLMINVELIYAGLCPRISYERLSEYCITFQHLSG